jgi:hypothetical protein
VSKKLLSAAPTVEEKVALGQVIPFIHAYGKTASSHPPSADWLVTHSWNVFKSFAGGVFKQADGTEVPLTHSPRCIDMRAGVMA